MFRSRITRPLEIDIDSIPVNCREVLAAAPGFDVDPCAGPRRERFLVSGLILVVDRERSG